MSVCVWVLYAFLNGMTDFDEIVCVCLSGSRYDLDSQLDLVDVLRQGFWDLWWAFLLLVSIGTLYNIYILLPHE